MLSKRKLELAKVLRPSKLESHALTSQPRMPKISKNQPPITQLHMLKNCQFDAAKLALITNRLILPVVNCKS